MKSVAEADTVMNALNEQNVYGDGDLADVPFVEMNETTDMLFQFDARGNNMCRTSA